MYIRLIFVLTCAQGSANGKCVMSLPNEGGICILMLNCIIDDALKAYMGICYTAAQKYACMATLLA